jgi:hypothetical protein
VLHFDSAPIRARLPRPRMHDAPEGALASGIEAPRRVNLPIEVR